MGLHDREHGLRGEESVAEGNHQAEAAFEELLDDHWEWTLREQPLTASFLGDPRYNDRWPDLTPAAHARRMQDLRTFLKRLERIDRAQLSAADQVNHRLLERELEMPLEAEPFGWHLVPLDQRGGIQTAHELAAALTFKTVQDYQNWLTRLERFPAYMDQTLELMRQGTERRIVQTQVVMKRLPAQIERQLVEDVTQSPFYKPFQSLPAHISDEEQTRLREAAQAAIATHVIPSYRRMLKFFNEVYLPACFEEVGVWQIPQGQEFYAQRARKFTTTELTPREIHEIGLKEVARIRQRMEEIQQEVEFEGSFREFLEFLRTDPQFYYTDPNEYYRAVQAVCKKIDPQLVKLFRKLPRIPYGVEPIPSEIAPDTTTAYYRPPSADGSRAGSYFINLYQIDQRPTYEIEVLSLHEAVPGHHLQIALAMELEDLPPFRRLGGYTAYIEGWGLYSESLGADLGLYEDPYSRMGQLTYEMWRAIRLVVDTGMHSLQWTRQQAIDLFLENTAKSRLDIENEVDRYISWPGQALAYKIGELKIQELRQQAEQQLGENFDIRDFHQVVLENGAVTLDVLEEQVHHWLATQSP